MYGIEMLIINHLANGGRVINAFALLLRYNPS